MNESEPMRETTVTNRRDRIIVIDPEQYIRDLLDEYLSKRGYAVTTASGKADGQAMLLEDAAQVALVDPGFGESAMETINWLRSDHPQVRMVLMSGQPTLNRVITAFRDGVFDFIVKPFCLDDLHSVIQRAASDVCRDDTISKLRSRVQVLEKQLRRHGVPIPGCSGDVAVDGNTSGGASDPRERHQLQLQGRSDDDRQDPA